MGPFNVTWYSDQLFSLDTLCSEG